MTITDVKIGADPEFFLYDTEYMRFVSAHDIVPGNKKEPHPLKCGAVQADGTAVEFNIDPASTAEEFEHNIHTVMDQIREMVPKKYSFMYTPIIAYTKDIFERLPISAVELGCDPDFNAKTGDYNPVIKPEVIGTHRTGSGHIHVGWTSNADIRPESEHFMDCRLLTRQLDFTLLPLSKYWDKNNKYRQEFYGCEGSFRPKPYGVEYRCLSNAWLSKPKFWKGIFKVTKDVFIKAQQQSFHPMDILSGDGINHVNRVLNMQGLSLKE